MNAVRMLMDAPNVAWNNKSTLPKIRESSKIITVHLIIHHTI